MTTPDSNPIGQPSRDRVESTPAQRINPVLREWIQRLQASRPVSQPGSSSAEAHIVRSYLTYYTEARRLLEGHPTQGSGRQLIGRNYWNLIFSEAAVESLGVAIPDPVLSRLYALETSVEAQGNLITHAIQPTVSKLARQLEGAPEPGALPPAATARYELQSKISDVFETTEKIVEEFEDLYARLSSYTRLQKQLADLLRLARTRSNRDFRDAVLTLSDATYNVYSEELTMSQVHVLRDMARQLQQEPFGRQEVRALDRSLRAAGFETIPSDKSRYPANG